MFVGGGPRTVGILERLAANAAEIPGSAGIDIHIVDPYPVGGGRIWRSEQSELLWMNSMARDVTIFTDSSVTCTGPIVPGPTLAEWVAGEGRTVLAAAGLGEQAAALRPDDFAGRQIQSHYLRWAHERAVASLPDRITVTEHPAAAVAVREDAAGQQVLLANGTELLGGRGGAGPGLPGPGTDTGGARPAVGRRAARPDVHRPRLHRRRRPVRPTGGRTRAGQGVWARLHRPDGAARRGPRRPVRAIGRWRPAVSPQRGRAGAARRFSARSAVSRQARLCPVRSRLRRRRGTSPPTPSRRWAPITTRPTIAARSGR